MDTTNKADGATVDFTAVRSALDVHRADLAALPGVISVRPGFRFAKGKLLPQAAVVVTVVQKVDKSALPSWQMIPPRLGDVLVDVAPASVGEVFIYQSRLRDAGGAANAIKGSVDLRLPGQAWGDLYEMDSVPLLPYPPRPDLPLELRNEEMTVICHASPDAGWRILHNFIELVQERLTATMYEIGADHIVKALSDLPAPHTFKAVFDSSVGSGPPQALQAALGDRFSFVWAATADSGHTTGGFFPSAYHIKVAVRDGKAFWLSSGNWKNSGQPFEDPREGPLPADPARFQRTHNREWHVVMENPGLAQLMEKHILRDFEQALPLQRELEADEGAALSSHPDLFVPIPRVSEADDPPQFLGELKVTRKVKVQPLLTPDNFKEYILPLIQGATQSLYFQNQTLTPTTANAELMKTLAAKSREANIDVRIIIRDAREFGSNVRRVLEALFRNGFNMDRIKVQQGCHNKGILVDGRYTVVGSHNWSGEGVTVNRDASLIFDDPEITAYYTQLFDYDWNHLAQHEDLNESDPVQIAGDEAEETPAGMMRVRWDDFFDETERIHGWNFAPENIVEDDDSVADNSMPPDSFDLNPAGFRSSDEVRPALILKQDGDVKPVNYSPVNGWAILEGDILLGKSEDVDALYQNPESLFSRGIGITGAQYRWKGGQVPYNPVPAALSDRVKKAIDHWEAKTPIRFIARTMENANQYPDYVSFEDQGGCFSSVGRQGGKQIISLGSACTVGNAIHEMGHSLGLWHEQSREDRDAEVTIQWENIQPGREHNFNQHVSDGDDIGPYDKGSIMHYSATAFSKNGLPTIVTSGGQSIGQRDGLSAGDIAAIKVLYPDLNW